MWGTPSVGDRVVNARGIPRWLEALVALVGLVVCLPVLAVAAVAVKLGSAGPAIFRQERVGRNGTSFRILKLRTMRVQRGGAQVTVHGDERITRMGRILRRAKIDELPGLWNVMCGDMSLVGPRPEVPSLVDLCSPVWREVLAVRPGITDPVTLRLRSEEEILMEAGGDPVRFYRERLQPLKLRGYLEYLRSRTPWSDARVLVGTVLAVLLPARVTPLSVVQEIEISHGQGANSGPLGLGAQGGLPGVGPDDGGSRYGVGQAGAGARRSPTPGYASGSGVAVKPIHPEARVFVAGHGGLVGGAILRLLAKDGFRRVLTRPQAALDLAEALAVDEFFRVEQPEFVFLAAAKVGGILANNTYPGDFIRDNLAMQFNVLDAARRHGVEKLVFLGSSCIYPKDALQPIREEYLLAGPLEPTNEPYAIAKIAGIKMCQAYWRQYGCRFISAMPTNLYGPGDNFDLKSSHVLPALLRKFHEAKESGSPVVPVWGSGRPRREFLHVDDLADACVFLMRHWESPEIINVGVGDDVTIAELADLVRSVVGYQGEIVYEADKPDGTPRKLLDVSRINELGWRARIPLRVGIEETYRWFLDTEVHRGD